jgi:hypothetical protein
MCSGAYPGRVVEIPVDALFAQLREMVVLLASPAGEQVSWLAKQHYPVDELALQLDDAVPAWFSRLREHQLLPEGAATALVDLNAYLGTIRSGSGLNPWSHEGLRVAPEWSRVRALATDALGRLSG